MFGRSADYALRALLFIARESRDGRYVRTEQIATATAMPANYTGKILNSLAREGLLTSSRGPAGGFRLARDAATITAAEIVDLFTAVPANRQCILGAAACSPRNPCEAHERWTAVLDAQRAPLAATTIASLITADFNGRKRHHAKRRRTR